MRRTIALFYLFCSGLFPALAQVEFPVNGIQNPVATSYAFRNVTLHISPDIRLENATLLIKDGKVIDSGTNITVPDDAIQVSLKGRHIYPGFIELWSSYGIPEGEKIPAKPNQFSRPSPGAFAWNMAIHPETDASSLFRKNENEADRMRRCGFTTVLSHKQDGIARGTGVLVSLAQKAENECMLRPGLGTFFSLKKGSSPQAYPSSQMGSIALLRQAFYDAEAYGANQAGKPVNLSLEALLGNKKNQAFFEADNWVELLRGKQIGDEFGISFIYKSGGDDYQRLDELKQPGIKLILPLEYPEAWDLSDSYSESRIPLSALLHWEAAPANAELVRRAGIPFVLSTHKLNTEAKMKEAFQKTIQAGLPGKELLRALTETPAAWLGVSALTGDLKKGKMANFFISSDTLGSSNMFILESWVQGQRFVYQDASQQDIRGNYRMKIAAEPEAELLVNASEFSPEAKMIFPQQSHKIKIERVQNRVNLSWNGEYAPFQGVWSLNGQITESGMEGIGIGPTGKQFLWSAVKTPKPLQDTAKTAMQGTVLKADSVHVAFPHAAYGFSKQPNPENILIKNATIWTCEKSGKLENASILVLDGKIKGIEKDTFILQRLIPKNTNLIRVDGTGLHITPGIVDEHSHIAISQGVNEAGQSITSEVRIGDVIDPRDRSIYYALAGGVTTVQQLHGSANAIGGQSSLIKLRWGQSAQGMKIKNAPAHIKFALGENVKQSNWGHEFTVRYPQTRMGVEQVFYDAFSRAKVYKTEREKWQSLGPAKRATTPAPARDLELDALVEILEGKRYITCHSYVQSEINMLMHVADSMGFKVNTFTHVLEGYKVADKLKSHGAAASTFSDWWAYKMEVNDAIPYNGALMHKAGVLTGFNSDDAEMGRRLNQEAAKSVLYGGLSEEDALNLVTINPARMLHIDSFTGSLKPGKDADLVIWTDNPLSIYSKVAATFIDGVRYYDAQRDKELQKYVEAERARIRMKWLADKNAGSSGKIVPSGKKQQGYCCEDLHCISDNFLSCEE